MNKESIDIIKVGIKTYEIRTKKKVNIGYMFNKYKVVSMLPQINDVFRYIAQED